jgi:signal transduction histidine kinase/CheY-like chemotaxis protein
MTMPTATRYVVALFCVFLAVLVHYSLGDILRDRPFPIFFLAVVIVAAVAGSGPTVAATFLSGIVAAYWFIEPAGAFTALAAGDLIRLTSFTVIGLSLAALVEIKDRALKRAVIATNELAEEKGRQLSDAAIKVREAFMRQVLDSLPHEVAVIDANGTVMMVNKPWESFAKENFATPQGVSPGVNYLDICRSACDEGDPFARRALKGIETLIHGGEEQFKMEYPCHAPDRERWFLMHAVRASASPATIVISHTDVTDRRNATEKLIQADRRKDEFLATLAHELRNPLAPIRNAIHLLRLDASKTGSSKGNRELLDISERQVEHLIRLVDDLLEVSRITTGKISLQKRPIELSEIMKTACEMAKPNFDGNGHRLEVKLPQAGASIFGDPVRLTQIFSNLLNNAAKYTEQGAVFFECEKTNGEAVVSVTDTGMGIPQDMLPHVFDLFAQIDRTLGRAQGGLGIGLALVKSLVEMHGGRVEAQSEGVDKGSKFTVHLPLIAGPQEQSPREETKQVATLASSPKVLVIDDDHDVADALAMLLEDLGAQVHVEYDGQGGVKAVESFKPALVFLDLGMPGMDGYETAKHIRALPDAQSIVIIALTGWGQGQIGQKARQAGFDADITKPADMDSLHEALLRVSAP